MKEVTITARDGTRIGAAIYAPESSGKFPALLAASPYRYDNNALPAGPQFLWRETGPIDFYVKQGYAYVHMDVRGSGKSGGQFEFLGPNEQNDLYDVIQWIAAQSWSNGKVGGLGQSYFCMSQWWMGIMAPPALACLGAYDGMNDPYRASCYQGGIPGQFIPGYWWNQNRIINRFPASGAEPRVQETDLDALVTAHPTYDDFWRMRCASERLHEIKLAVCRREIQKLAARRRQIGQRHVIERWQPHPFRRLRRRLDDLQLPQPWLGERRRRLRPLRSAELRSGAARADVHHAAAGKRSGDRRGHQARAVRVVHPAGHRLRHQALRAI